MEIQVIVSLSDRLFSLLEDKLPNLGRRIEKAVTKEVGAQTRKESNIAVSVIAAPAEENEAADAPIAEQPAVVDAPAVVETPVAADAPAVVAIEVPAQVAATLSDMTPAEQIRAIMHRTRQRFEGEDYKENAGSELYKKHHKTLTGLFKLIAISLGYEKPACIDTPEKIEAFAAECDALIVDENGFVAFPPAPY